METKAVTRRPDVTRDAMGCAVSVVITKGEWQMFFTTNGGKMIMPHANFGEPMGGSQNLAGQVPQQIYWLALKQAAAILKPSSKKEK